MSKDGMDVMKHKRQSQRPVTLESGGEGDLDMYFEFLFGTHRPAVHYQERGWHPPADLYETVDEVVIRVDIAGIDLEDVNVVLNREHLLIRGIRREPPAAQKRQYHKMEVSYGAFERVFRMPAPVCAAGAKAEYGDGILTIRLQKRPTPVQRKVTIRIT